MADILGDKATLAYLFEQVLLADADAPITLEHEWAGVQTALDLMLLEVSQDMPLTVSMIIPLKDQIRLRKMSCYSLWNCAKSKDSRITFVII